MGPPIPEGPKGRSGEGNQPLVGWCAPLGPPPAPRVETLGWGEAPLALGVLHPPWPPPPWEIGSPRAGAPLGAYIKGGGEGQPHPEVLAPPPPATPLPPPSRAWRSPAGVLLFHHHHAVVLLLEPSSSTSPSPLLDQEGGDVTRTVRVLNAEVPSVRR